MPDNYPKAPRGSAPAAFFASMEKAGARYAGARGSGGAYYCLNPGHMDDRPSLDVAYNGRVVLFTCTPCRQAMGQDAYMDLLRSHGVKWQGEACDPSAVEWGDPCEVASRPVVQKKGGPKGEVRLTAVHFYRFEDGSENFKVRRFDPVDDKSKARKFFAPMRWESGAGWVGKAGALDGVERTPYNLDRFEEWKGGVLYFVEGEKAADAITGHGRAATTFHGGADGKVEDGWVEKYGFKRFAQVRVWPDADEAGVQRARMIHDALVAGGVNAVFYGAPDVEPKDDAFDVLARKQKCRTLDEEDLAVLIALHPLPSVAGGDADAPVIGGKALVSAKGFKAPETAVEDEEPVEGEVEPYPVSLATQPSPFAGEMLAREFTDDRGVLTLRHFDGGFWLWEEGRFIFVDPDDAEALLTARLDGRMETGPDGKVRNVPWNSSRKRELVNALKDRARDSRYGLGGELLPAEGGIPFRNGFLNVKTGVLTPIGPERKIQWVLDAEYDENAECPEWEAFLASCGFGPETDEYRLMRQWFGYLVSGSKKFEKGMLLIGKSRAGKGVTINVAQALFGGVGPYGGAYAVEAETLVESHGYENMPGKGLITLPETRFTGRDRKVNARLLSLTSNDAVRINPKMKKPFSTVLPGRLMIGTNETPRFVEATDALAKRLLVIRYNISHEADGRTPDTGLFDRLKRELAGIARWSLDGIADLEAEGKFIDTAAGREVREMMIEGGSYMHQFLDDCFERVDPSEKLSNALMHKVYQLWRKDTDAPPMTPTGLASKFTDTYPDIERYKVGNKRGRYGLKVKPKWQRLVDLVHGDDDE